MTAIIHAAPGRDKGALPPPLRIVPAPVADHAHRLGDLEQTKAELELAAGHYAIALGENLIRLAELRLAGGAR